MFLAEQTLLLIVLGALVTSNDAGLSVPDWPTSFGSFYKIPPMVGGVKYEHGHRMFAEFVGLLIIVMAVWTQRVEQRKWMKALGLDRTGSGHWTGRSRRPDGSVWSAVDDLDGARHAGANDLLRRDRDGALHQPELVAGCRPDRGDTD